MARAAVELTCRKLVPADLPAVMEIEEASFLEPWSTGLFTQELDQPSRRYLVAETRDALVGYGGIMLIGEEATVVTLAVAPGVRERGVASRLLCELVELAHEAGAKHLTLEVRESNRAALDLYSKFGFEPAGRRKGYYTTEDAVIMWAVDIDSAEYREVLAALRKEAA